MNRKLKRKFSLFIIMIISIGGIFPRLEVKATTLEDTILYYEEYQKHFQAIERLEDIEPNGYRVLEEQVFWVAMESFKEEELMLVPAIERRWHRLALFLVNQEGNVLYKENQLETNHSVQGEMLQPVEDIASIAFADVNRDGMTDIILITHCKKTLNNKQTFLYKVGDVLFQKEGGFYRDWRISDKINRFSMNKSANLIITFVRDGRSCEFLYTATTLEELLSYGFVIEEEQCYTRNFEKLGNLKVVPGTFQISAYNMFMVYLVNAQGDIVWSFQPMGDYDSLYSLKGINGRDVDGDGMKDLVVLARYSMEGPKGEPEISSHCAIYYQRTGGFEIDTEFEDYYHCTEEDTMEELIVKIREYWGWQVKG